MFLSFPCPLLEALHLAAYGLTDNTEVCEKNRRKRRRSIWRTNRVHAMRALAKNPAAAEAKHERFWIQQMTGCICMHFLSVFLNHEAQCIMRTTIILNIPRGFVRAPATRTSKRVNKAVLTPFGSPTCMGLLCHCSKSTQDFASASLYSCKSFTVCRSHFERCTASELSTSISPL